MSWTDERIATLKKMWKEGKSAAEIAKTLGKGVTRNAVIGKAHRMGLSGRPSPIKKSAAPKKEAAPKKTAAKATRSKKAAAPAAAPSSKSAPAKEAAEDVRIFEKDVVPAGGGVALLDLTERMCKWPIGDPRDDDFTFCGLAIRPGTPYCPDHAAMAYQTSSRNRGVAAAAKKVSPAEAVDDEVDTDDDDVDDDTLDADDDDVA